MARRPRRQSSSGQIVRDASFIANRVSWKVAVVMAITFFALFYWGLPAWFQVQIESARTPQLKPMLEAVIGRRIRWSQLLGIALGLACLAFAAWNYFRPDRMGRSAERGVGFVSRLLAKFFR